MKGRHVVIGSTLIGTIWLAFFENSEKIVEPTDRKIEMDKRSTSRPLVSSRSKKTESEIVILTLQSRALVLDVSKQEKLGQLFQNQSWNPPPPPPPKPAPPPPPSAPALPFTYIGKQIEENKWQVFLARDDRTYVVAENTVIDETYRVNSIKPPILSLTYLPMNQVQTLPIGRAE